MKVFWHLILCALLACVVHCDPQAGAGIEISSKALNYIQSVALPILQAKLAGIDIPAISGQAKGFDYAVDHIRMNSLTLGATSLATEGDGLRLTVSNIDVSISANWRFRQHDIHFPSGSGTLKGEVSGTSSITTLVGLSVSNDCIHCASKGTNTRIDQLKITVSGSMFSWLYNLILDDFNKSVKSEIISQINSSVDDFINNDINKLLATTTSVFRLPLPAPFDTIYADMTPQDVLVSPTGFEMDVRGAIFIKSQPAYPVAPPTIPTPNPTVAANYMMCVTFSSYVMNSGMWSAYNADMLNYEITPNDIPGSFQPLNTSFIHSFAPGVYQAFPNAAMHCRVSASSAPEFFASPVVGGDAPVVNVLGQADFLFRVVAPNGTLVDAFVLTCPLNMSGDPSVNGNTVHANLTFTSCPLTTKSSNYGPVQAQMLSMLVNSLLQQVAIPQVNKAIAGGFPVPTVDGVSLNDGLVTIDAPNSLHAFFDFSYKYSTAQMTLMHMSARNENKNALTPHASIVMN